MRIMTHYRQLLVQVLMLANACASYRILCLLPYPGKSHYDVFAPLLDELAERGHQLTVVSFFPAATPQRNRRDVSLVGIAPLNVEVVDIRYFDNSYFGLARYVEHIPVATQLARSNLELCEKLLNEDVFREFVEAEGDYDVVLVEHFNSDCMLGLVHNYQLPSVGLMSCALLPFSFYRVGAPDNPSFVPGMTLPFTDEMSFVQRVENTFILFFYNVWYEIRIRWNEQRVLENRLGKKLPPLGEVAKNTSVVLVNTHYSLNGVRVVPPSVVEVGGIHLHNRTILPLPPSLEQLVSKAKDGFILLSFGSLIKGHTLPVTRLGAILKVFSRLPQIVIWKWEADMEELPENVHVMKWLPQYDLLRHPKCVAFISHGGVLSLTEAAAAGVPTLTVPILGDQFGNAAHAEKAGLAKVLSLRDLDEASFERALKEVLSENMKQKARQLSEIWKDKPIAPMDLAVYYIEKTARHRGLHMSSHGRWLNRLQLSLLDVTAFLLLSLAILALSVYCLWKR